MKLLEPFSAGRLTLKNRVVISSYAAYHGLYHPRESSDWYVEHLRRRNAVGLLVLQCAFPRFVGIDPPPDRDALISKLRRCAEAVHDEGAKALLQLAHQGPHTKGLAQPDMKALQGFSSVQSEVCADVAHEMEPREIAAFVDGFGELAEIAMTAGLDGVELHAGHGHLLHQSINPWMNFRGDDWGTPLHFINAVAEKVRGEVGDGVVGIRFSCDDHRPVEQGGHTVEELRRLACEVVSTGLLDYLNPIEGSRYAHYYRSVGTYRRPHGDFLVNTKAMREAIAGKVPVICVGRIVTVEEAEQALDDGAGDLVALTRAHIADPDFLRKVQEGESDRIRKCVGSNQGCLDRAHEGAPLTCFQNPDVGREDRVGLVVRATEPKRVVVVGGGPAGLKAAEIAARRGHTVTLIDARSRLGGRLASITDVSEARELLESIDWIERELALLAVTVRSGVQVDAALLDSLRPDAIVIATGSRPGKVPFPNDDSVEVLSTDEALERMPTGDLAEVLVYDVLGNEEASVTYEQLAAAGVNVSVVTPHAQLGIYLGHTHAVDQIDRVLDLGCSIEERTTIVEVVGGMVTTLNGLTRQRLDRRFDAIVLAGPRLPDVSLADHARQICASVQIVGDAYSPRTAMQAFRDGDDAGRRI